MKTKSLILILICTYSLLFGTGLAFANNKANNGVLFWIVLEKNNATEFLIGDLHQGHLMQLNHSAQAYGLNALVPMLDLSERILLHEQDVAQFKWDALLSASQRYNAAVIVAGKLKQQNGAWECTWQIYDPVQPQAWVSTGKDLHEQFAMMTEVVATRTQTQHQSDAALASTTVKEAVKVRVKGVDTLERYSMVLQYLEGLAVTANVELNGLFGDEAIFTVNTNADKFSVAHAISNENILSNNPNINSNEYLEYKVSS